MPIDSSAAGKTFPATDYVVGREKIREYAAAVGETRALHRDPKVARAAGYRDVLAPPMFAVVYKAGAVLQALTDRDVGLDMARVVHGAQEFVWDTPVVAGDEIATTCTVKEIFERGGNGFYVFETQSRNQQGAVVCTGTWTNIVRGG